MALGKLLHLSVPQFPFFRIRVFIALPHWVGESIVFLYIKHLTDAM